MPTREIKGDIFAKKLWGAALNITFAIPIIPMVSYGIGKIFQQTHEEFGLGSTLARTFLGIAKLGLENSAFPLKKKDGKASWPVGTFLNGVKKSINNIDRREKELGIAGYFRNFFSSFTATIGFVPNLGAAFINIFGDVCDGIANFFLDQGKEAGIITKGICYTLANVAFSSGLVFKVPAVLLKLAGSILTADAKCLPEASIGGWIASNVNFFDNCRFGEKAKVSDTPRDIAKDLSTLRPLTDSLNDAVSKKAIELFKKIKGPKFKKSGITGNDDLYCAVAKIKFEGESYELLLSPESGSFLIANPKTDLNTLKDAERDTLDSIDHDKRQSFSDLIKNLKVTDTFYKSDENLITMTKNNPGLSYEEFMGFKSSADRERETIRFEIDSNEYEFSKTNGNQKRTLKNLSRPDGNRDVGTLNEFMILNRLAKNHIKEIPQQKSESGFPGVAVKSPTAVRLMETQSKQETKSFSSFFSR
jgi:hypothetical protein